jgi:hypothetical protein
MLALIVLTLSLSSCAPPINITGTAKIVLSGSYYYNIKMDDYTYFSNKAPDTYYITDITPGYHKFEAIDIGGSSWGSDTETVYISAGSTTTVYLNPTQTTSKGTVYIYVYGDYFYDIKMDDYTYFYEKSEGMYTLTNVSIGYHTFEAVDSDGAFWGSDSESKYISSGANYVYLYP